MTVKSDIITACQVAADATGDAQTMIGMGAPGRNIKNVIDQIKPTGIVWDESPSKKPFVILIEGLAAFLGSQLSKKRVVVTEAYAAKAEDGILAVTEVALGGYQITIPTVEAYGVGNEIIIKDENGLTTGVSTVSVVVDGGGAIDGVTMIALNTPYHYHRLYAGVTKWSRVS